MICNILCVGTELLLGQIDDTNSSYIARRLSDAGILSYEHRRIGDNHRRLFSEINSMLDDADVLIITGGLGPTHDDITREVMAEVMGVELNQDDEIVEKMKQHFASRNRDMSSNNLRQAMVPDGARVLSNPLGTAPGLKCLLQHNGVEKITYLLPGVPHEMEFMINEFVIPDLVKRAGSNVIVTRTIKTWGIPESNLAEMLDKYVQHGETDDIKIGFLARGINGILVKLSTAAVTKESAEEKIKPVENEVLNILGDCVYAFDGETMESVVIDLLRNKKMRLAVGESLTGGMILSRLVDVSGASDVLAGGVVSYSIDVKKSVLGVNADDVYSHECAKEMAQGVKKHLNADIAISTTGVAGPGPDGGHNPGEIYIGISSHSETISEEFSINGDRRRIREYTTITALDCLRKYLTGLE